MRSVDLSQAAAAYSNGDLAGGLVESRKVLDVLPDQVVALNIAALCSIGLGAQAEAERYWRRAVKASPNDADLHLNLGLLQQEMGRFGEAEALFRRVLKLKPGYIEGYFNLGNVLRALDKLPEAEAALRKAIALRADYAEAYNNLGLVLQSQKRFGDAEAAFQRALELNPDLAAAHYNLGRLLADLKRFDAAEVALNRALDAAPDYADAHIHLGLLLLQKKRHEAAEACFRRAIEIDPGQAIAHNNLGLLFGELKRHAEAEAAYRRALEIRPDYAGAYSNLGILLRAKGAVADAEAAFRQALVFDPIHAEARLNLAMLLLYSGRFGEGWPLYEARYSDSFSGRQTPPPEFSYPQWQGEDLCGKSLLVWSEQGFGDSIQFVRYLALMKTQGVARITFVCEAPLLTLLQSLDGIDVVARDGYDPASPHDFWTFLLSIPLHQKTTLETIPSEIPYLAAPEAHLRRWQALLPDDGFKVGLVWKGRPTHKNDANRSLSSLTMLAPLWKIPGIRFVSLQKGSGEDEVMRVSAKQPLTHVGADIQDFADSAAVLAQLDLLICVDTAAAHLAGALGKPCWVLLPSEGVDWRWLQLRDDSPWYPNTIRLFRQKTGASWSVVIDELAPALRELVHSAAPARSKRAFLASTFGALRAWFGGAKHR